MGNFSPWTHAANMDGFMNLSTAMGLHEDSQIILRLAQFLNTLLQLMQM